MANLFMPADSFEFEDEREITTQIESKFSRLLKEIDANVMITIIGRNNTDFWDGQVTVPLSRNMILNPKNEKPVEPTQDITHLAVVTTKVEQQQGYLYGNTGSSLPDFVRAVIFKTMIKFPSRLN
ncbi:MAG: hypothetical protein ACRENF_07840 [Thermodesulfobacteriota bacterium]